VALQPGRRRRAPLRRHHGGTTCTTVYAQDGYQASVRNLARVGLSSDNVFGDHGGASWVATVSGDV
jgi:hypothetical protein